MLSVSSKVSFQSSHFCLFVLKPSHSSIKRVCSKERSTTWPRILACLPQQQLEGTCSKKPAAPSLPPRPSRAFLKDSHSRAPQGVDPYLKLQVTAQCHYIHASCGQPRGWKPTNTNAQKNLFTVGAIGPIRLLALIT